MGNNMSVHQLIILGALWACAGGCATQREQRISSADARERPSDEDCQPKGTSPAEGWVWACGYWHWDSVRYVWIEGKWQPARAHRR